jgi:CTP synthase (UTP-ammonia lyase)
MHSATRIGLIGDFNDQHKAHQAIPKSLSAASGGAVEAVWIPTDSVGNGSSLDDCDGVWCVPGMPYRNSDGAMQAIRHAREKRKPFLGTSAGFQYAVIEFARNVLGLAEADHQKTNPKAAMPLISPLGLSLLGVRARVRFTEGSHLRKAYRTPQSTEEYHCSFGLNNRYRRLIEGRGLYVAAVDDQDEIRAIEVDGHPFFVATLFQPEMSAVSSGAAVNPLVQAFVTVCDRRHHGAAKVAG